MAEKRIITSDIWQDDWFGELPFFEKLLWIGLFSRCADDQGRMIDNPVVIRATVFPYDDIPVNQIEQALQTYESCAKVIRYEIEGKHYLQIKNWWDHQQGQWAIPSKYPAPDGWNDRVRSYIKGEYREENWDKKGKSSIQPTSVHPGVHDDEQLSQVECPPGHPTLIPHLDTPPGQSTWASHVAGHDPDPDPDPKKKTATAASKSDFFRAEYVNQKESIDTLMHVTGNLHLTEAQIDYAVPAVRAIAVKHKDDLLDYLSEYYEAWRGRGYSKTNYAWLEWAAAGEIPKQKQKEKSFSERLAEA
jgi:hypothetical protein